MEEVQDAWRHDDVLGWLPHTPGVDDAQLTEEADPYIPVAPLASSNAIGIDCARYQGVPDFAQVAASGRSFCYLKSSDGASSSYPSLDPQYQGARAAGVLPGLYHYGQAALSPIANADAFSAQINRLGAVAGHLPPCLDLEAGTGDLNAWAQQFVARLRANTGCVRVMIYSSASYFQSGAISENWMDANIALWVAHFGAPPGKPAYLTPRVSMHQYSDAGQVAGVAGNVDLDWCVWPLATLVPTPQGSTPVTTPPAATTASVLTAAEQAMLLACYQQFSGSSVVGQWTGWPSWPGGSGRSLTLVDYCRNLDVEMVALKADLDALKAQAAITPGVPSALSDADVAKIAAAVAGMLAARLQS